MQLSAEVSTVRKNQRRSSQGLRRRFCSSEGGFSSLRQTRVWSTVAESSSNHRASLPGSPDSQLATAMATHPPHATTGRCMAIHIFRFVLPQSRMLRRMLMPNVSPFRQWNFVDAADPAAAPDLETLSRRLSEFYG